MNVIIDNITNNIFISMNHTNMAMVGECDEIIKGV
jgi:hypothetical protein